MNPVGISKIKIERENTEKKREVFPERNFDVLFPGKVL